VGCSVLLHVGRYAISRHARALYDLCRASLGVAFNAASLGPFIGIVMMIDIGDEKTVGCLMNDDANIAIATDRPKIRIFGFINPVE